MNRQQHIRRSGVLVRRGVNCVEFAIVAPVIFLLFLGAIEMTHLNFLRHTANNAAYEGAREAILAEGTAEGARDQVTEVLRMAGASQGVETLVDEEFDRVTVTVRLPVHLNTWGLGRFSSGFVITQSCTLTREKPRTATP